MIFMETNRWRVIFQKIFLIYLNSVNFASKKIFIYANRIFCTCWKLLSIMKLSDQYLWSYLIIESFDHILHFDIQLMNLKKSSYVSRKRPRRLLDHQMSIQKYHRNRTTVWLKRWEKRSFGWKFKETKEMRGAEGYKRKILHVWLLRTEEAFCNVQNVASSRNHSMSQRAFIGRPRRDLCYDIANKWNKDENNLLRILKICIHIGNIKAIFFNLVWNE